MNEAHTSDVAGCHAHPEDCAVDDQREVVAFLSEGANFGKPGSIVERLDTHISFIFLIGDRAYKLKRAVCLPYLNYSTAARREGFCRAELALNRRTAPSLYRCVHAITRETEGGLVFDGKGQPIDWVIEMQRFSQDDLFDRLGDSGKLTPALMRDLADAIAAFHKSAKITPEWGGRAQTEKTIAGNNIALIAACPPLDRGVVDSLNVASLANLATVGTLLDSRRDSGKVRSCHGDLHLRNICLIEGHATLFDCIEFSDALACIDLLYDLAFLLMDLVYRGLQDLASVVFNRYLDITGDIEGLPAIPLFMSMRAAIRAHVLGTQARENSARQSPDEAQSYLALASALLRRPHRVQLIAIGGLSGTGKSTIAQALAGDFFPTPGARVIRSDVLRKRLFRVMPETRLCRSAYERGVTERVYSAVHDEASTVLATGYVAIVDATFLREEERNSIAALAKLSGVPFLGLWLEAPAEVLTTRLGRRYNDASDADAGVLQQQLEAGPGAVGWCRIDVSGDLTQTLVTVRRLIDANMRRSDHI
jgi:uncharacterized protein